MWKNIYMRINHKTLRCLIVSTVIFFSSLNVRAESTAMKEFILLSEWLYDSKLMVSDDILLILYIDCHCEYPTANKIIELFPYDTFTEFTPYNTNTVNGHDHLPHMCWIGSSHIADALCSPHI